MSSGWRTVVSARVAAWRWSQRCCRATRCAASSCTTARLRGDPSWRCPRRPEPYASSLSSMQPDPSSLQSTLTRTRTLTLTQALALALTLAPCTRWPRSSHGTSCLEASRSPALASAPPPPPSRALSPSRRSPRSTCPAAASATRRPHTRARAQHRTMHMHSNAHARAHAHAHARAHARAHVAVNFA